jgi:hypothetical protein
VGASWYFYVQNRLLFDFTYPLLSSALVYLTLVFSNYMSEQAQRRRIARLSASISRRRWSSSSRSRPTSSCSAAKTAK